MVSNTRSGVLKKVKDIDSKKVDEKKDTKTSVAGGAINAVSDIKKLASKNLKWIDAITYRRWLALQYPFITPLPSVRKTSGIRVVGMHSSSQAENFEGR